MHLYTCRFGRRAGLRLGLRLGLGFGLCFGLCFGWLGAVSLLAQGVSPGTQRALSPAEVAARADSSLAVVLAGKSANQPAVAGVAVAIRPNGVLLTAYHLLKDARAVQVRLNNGETFDRVQLLGVDARRDIAAIRITATLSVLPTGGPAESAAGDKVTLVSLGVPPQWTPAEGSLSGYSMADEVPGAGQGYRVIRFQATGLPLIFNGGVLLDSQARVLGLASTISLAVPVDSVMGLADSAVSRTFASGAALKAPVAESAEAKAPSAASSTPKLSATATPGKEDRRGILRSFKTIYIDADQVKIFGSPEMKAALEDDHIFQRLNLDIVDNRDAADAVLTVKRSLKTDYPFELTSRGNTMLLRGSGLGYTPEAGARDVARQLSQLINGYRPRSEQAARPDQGKLPADPNAGQDELK